MGIRHFLLIILLLIVAGCATGGTVQVKRGEELLAKSEKRVFSVDQIRYDPIELGDRVGFAFDKEATVLEQDGHRCFGKGFVLPTSKEAYSVSITSYKSGTPNDPAIMYPEVRLLNKDYTVSRTLPHTEFVFRSLGHENNGLNTVFFVNHKVRSESYLLITNRRMDEASLISSQDKVESVIPIVVPFPGGAAVWIIRTDKSTAPIRMKASPTGEMTVEIKEYRPKKVGE